MAAILGTKTRGGAVMSFSTTAWLTILTFQNSALILVMHYSRVVPVGQHRFFTSTAVFLNEVIKLAISLTLTMYESSQTLAPSTPATVLLEQLWNSIFAGDGWKLAIPAAFNTLQNLLQYVAVGNLDAVQFQVLFQLKILTTALFSVALLRRSLGVRRWVSLIVLTIGVSIVSLPSSTATRTGSMLLHGVTDHFFPRSLHELGHAAPEELAPGAAPHLTRRSATYEGIDNDVPPLETPMNYSLGVSSVLIAAAVSGLTSVYFEKILKESPTQASLWVRNVQMSFYSAVAALFGGVMWQDGAGIREFGFFAGYNTAVWTAVLLQALGALVASLVIRDADNIVKMFATSISIVVSFLISVWVFKFTVTFTFVAGTSLVLFSTYMYSLPERGLHRPPPIRIASFEKPTIESIFTPRVTPRSTPRSTDAKANNTDPFEGKGLGISSSRPGSPRIQRTVSKSNVKRED